jgi:hypothetical protein
MPSFWQRVSTDLHTIFGLLDDMGDISSALVITLATIRVAVAFVRPRTRRASARRTLSYPRRRLRRRSLPMQRYESNAHPPGRRKAA